MTESEEAIGTLEWYDFIGILTDILPALHLGGAEATMELLKMLPLEPDTGVLDVGCGAGHTACEISKRYGSRVTGIDISEVMIEKAVERARKERVDDMVDFRVADALQLPFDDDSYDVAILESLLTPLPGNKIDALRETFRVLSPGGLVGANETVFFPSAPSELFELADGHPAIHGMFTPQTLRDLFEESGLQVVDLIERRGSEVPSATRESGVLGILSFMVGSYWKVLVKMLSDPRFRKAQRIDDKLTKILKDHGGYVLIVGQKPQ